MTYGLVASANRIANFLRENVIIPSKRYKEGQELCGDPHPKKTDIAAGIVRALFSTEGKPSPELIGFFDNVIDKFKANPLMDSTRIQRQIDGFKDTYSPEVYCGLANLDNELRTKRFCVDFRTEDKFDGVPAQILDIRFVGGDLKDKTIMFVNDDPMFGLDGKSKINTLKVYGQFVNGADYNKVVISDRISPKISELFDFICKQFHYQRSQEDTIDQRPHAAGSVVRERKH